MISLYKGELERQKQPHEKHLLISQNNDILIQMKIKGKIILTFVLVAMILPSIQAHSKTEFFLNETSPLETNITSATDNISIEMITNLPSQREDNIPSVRPGDSFSASFNITNISDQEMNLLEVSTETNGYGAVLDPTLFSKDSLAAGESWITDEKTIVTVTEGGTASEALDLAIVLDQSGSMNDEIDALIEELINVVDEIKAEVPDLRVGLILFGGDPLYNPLISNSLITHLTSDISVIVDVLSNRGTSGGQEPWGDALYCAKNYLEWRLNAVKLVIVITDEPNNSGSLIRFNSDLIELYGQYAAENFILCPIMASGGSSTAQEITRGELIPGADITGGTYIEIGTEYPQTEDIPDLIGELIVLYSIELDFKIIANLTYEIDPGVREFFAREFVVLLDEIPPEIDTWIYFSEDFLTDEKFVTIMSEVKDVTGIPFVEIYYKFDNTPFWTISNATSLFNDSYCLSLAYDYQDQNLYYKIYTKDWIGNEIFSEEQIVDLSSSYEYSIIPVSSKKEITLMPNQQVILRLTGASNDDSYGIIFSDSHDFYDIMAADIDSSTILINKIDSQVDSLIVPAEHTVKVSLIASGCVSVIIANVIPETVEFKETFTVAIDYNDVYLYRIDNRFQDEENRQFYADSKEVQTGIYVFNASSLEYLSKKYASVELAEEEYLMLVVADYHTGQIEVGFTYESEYTPYEHYYQTEGLSWPVAIAVLGLAALLGFYKQKKR